MNNKDQYINNASDDNVIENDKYNFENILDIKSNMNDKTTDILKDLDSILKEQTNQTLDEIIDKCNKLKEEKSTNNDKYEPILMEENRRFTVYPIKYPRVWEMYKKQLACFWKTEEIDFSTDKDDFEELNDHEQHFLKMILAFFAASDGIVNFNLAERFTKDVKIMEAQIAYAFQMMMENQHGETYSLMLDNIISDKKEREKLFNAIETIPPIKKMADWAFKWIDSSHSFAHRCVAFAAIEGIFFSGAFAAIFWFKKFKNKGKLFLKGLTMSNEFIARDEGLHCDFACLLYSLLKYKLPESEILKIVCEAVDISIEFTDYALPYELIGMNKKMMSDYIKYICDRLVCVLGYKKIYNTTNPFKFMETIGLIGKTNFFEKRNSEYQDAHVLDEGNGEDFYDFGDNF